MTTTKPPPNHRLYYGDCVSIMRLWVKDDEVDLVYLDPPWRADRDLNVLHCEMDGSKSAASIEAFSRTWRWDNDTRIARDALMADSEELATAIDSLRRYYFKDDNTFAYLVQMGTMLVEVRRVMRPGGSVYLHCDPDFSAPLRMLADAVFVGGYQDTIIRAFRTMPSGAEKYRRGHETLLYYTKGPQPKTFNTAYEPPAPSTMKRMNGQGQHRAPGSKRKVRTGKPAKATLRNFWEPETVWDMPILAAMAKEKMPEFRTQKSLALLHRIISISSNQGDLVLDPFCGSGVTLCASHLLGRRSLSMDITHVAINRILQRLAAGPEYAEAKPEVHGDPVDLASARALAAINPDALQDWVGRRLGASGVHTPGPDSGIDDRIRFRDGDQVHMVIVSVKGGEKVKPAFVDELIGVVARREAALGVFVSFHEPTDEMKNRGAVGVWTSVDGRSYPKIQFLTIADVLSKRRVEMPTTLATSDVPQNQRYHETAMQGVLPGIRSP